MLLIKHFRQSSSDTLDIYELTALGKSMTLILRVCVFTSTIHLLHWFSKITKSQPEARYVMTVIAIWRESCYSG